MTVFVSHSSRDDSAVQTLVKHLEAANERVWLDTKLSGGQAWWDEILHQIRSCKVFVFALSNNASMSKPCQAELGYAKALGLPILPVQIGDTDRYRIDPMFTDLVDYRDPGVDNSIKMITTLSEKAAERVELPDPLPAPPPIPYEYLQRLGGRIESPDPLSPVEQAEIIMELRQSLTGEADASVAEDVRQLLRALRRRSDVTFTAAEEIDAVLAQSPSSSPPEPGRQTQGPPASGPSYQTTPSASPWDSGARPVPQFAAAPPGGPPVPSWGGARPSGPPNRGRWIALAAGGIVVVAVVGLVLWLVLRPGSSTDSTSARSDTSTSTTKSTTTTKATASASSAVAQLRRGLPDGYSPSACEAGKPIEGEIATVKCGPNTADGGPKASFYSLFPNATALETGFKRWLTALKEDSELRLCPDAPTSPGKWHKENSPDATAGYIACLSHPNGAVVAWTDYSKRLLGVTKGDALQPLLDWWAKNA